MLTKDLTGLFAVAMWIVPSRIWVDAIPLPYSVSVVAI